MITMHNLFPNSEILGCDIDLSLSSGTQNLPGPVFLSTPGAITENGPYDLIMANSVLYTKDPKNLAFSEFASWASVLHENLKPDGLLCMYNASYRFSDLAFAGEYRPIRCAHIFENGFMPKWSSTGTQISIRRRKRGVDRQEILRPELVGEGDFRDCIFEKTAGPPVDIDISDVDIPVSRTRLAPAFTPLWRRLTTSVVTRLRSRLPISEAM